MVAQGRGLAVVLGGGIYRAWWIEGSAEHSKKGALLLWEGEETGKDRQ